MCAVIAHSGPGVGMRSSLLDVAEGHACVWGGGDERVAQGMRPDGLARPRHIALRGARDVPATGRPKRLPSGATKIGQFVVPVHGVALHVRLAGQRQHPRRRVEHGFRHEHRSEAQDSRLAVCGCACLYPPALSSRHLPGAIRSIMLTVTEDGRFVRIN